MDTVSAAEQSTPLRTCIEKRVGSVELQLVIMPQLGTPREKGTLGHRSNQSLTCLQNITTPFASSSDLQGIWVFVVGRCHIIVAASCKQECRQPELCRTAVAASSLFSRIPQKPNEYIHQRLIHQHIRPQVSENWASRPLCHT